MINILTNIWYALLALLIFTGFLHLFLVYPRNLTKKQWKKVDYIWLAFTAIGLIGAIDNVRLIYSRNLFDLEKMRSVAQYEYVISFLDSAGSPVVCKSSIKNEFSPDNFDEIVEDNNKSCEWSKRMFVILNSINPVEMKNIDIDAFPNLETKENIWFRNIILDGISQYNELVNEALEMQQTIDDIENSNFVIYSPFFLILGLAIRITKVTGEVRHEKD